MSADEHDLALRLRALRAEVIDPTIRKHGGWISPFCSDSEPSVWALFDKTVGAVGAAVEMQRAVTRHEAAFAEEGRIAYGIGIHLGKVARRGDTVLGDTVQLALRLAMHAPPGSIYLLEDGWREVCDKLDLEFEDLGERGLVNVNQFPLRRFYSVKLD